MACLAAILRKSASSMATPLSLRFISSRAKNQGSLFFSLNRASIALLQGPSSVPRYSSIASPKRPVSDEVLLRLVNREIKCEEEENELDQTGEVPNGFPFQIEHVPGNQTLSLTGKYHNETIKIEISVADLKGDDENSDQVDSDDENSLQVDSDDTDDDEDTDSSDDNESDGSDEGKDDGFCISLDVSVSKENGSSLNFDCTAFPDVITINGVSAENSESSEDQEIDRFVCFSELEDDMQKALNKFLEMRGINTSTISFLHQYMMNKDDKEYKKEHLKWLKNLKKFLEA